MAGIFNSSPDYVEKRREYMREYYRSNAEKFKDKAAKRYEEKKDEINARLRTKRKSRKTGFGESRSAEYRRKYYLEFLVESAMRDRLRALQKVSGLAQPRCAGCGLDDFRILEINHINGGGRKESIASGFRKMAKAIISGERTTTDLNVLCASCNKLYEYERGRRRLPANWEDILKEEVSRGRTV